jgi:hypothetical protein
MRRHHTIIWHGRPATRFRAVGTAEYPRQREKLLAYYTAGRQGPLSSSYTQHRHTLRFSRTPSPTLPKGREPDSCSFGAMS